MEREKSVPLHLYNPCDFEGIMFSGIEIWGKLYEQATVSLLDTFSFIYEGSGDTVSTCTARSIEQPSAYRAAEGGERACNVRRRQNPTCY
jgi:hypothetical protein